MNEKFQFKLIFFFTLDCHRNYQMSILNNNLILYNDIHPVNTLKQDFKTNNFFTFLL